MVKTQNVVCTISYVFVIFDFKIRTRPQLCERFMPNSILHVFVLLNILKVCNPNLNSLRRILLGRYAVCDPGSVVYYLVTTQCVIQDLLYITWSLRSV